MTLAEILQYAEIGAMQTWLNNIERVRELENMPDKVSKDVTLMNILREASDKYYEHMQEIRTYLSGYRAKDYSDND
jgi:hypothetical protein